MVLDRAAVPAQVAAVRRGRGAFPAVRGRLRGQGRRDRGAGPADRRRRAGGCIASGEPIGASGLRQVYETVLQLRGQATGRQVEGARDGGADGAADEGGLGSVAVFAGARPAPRAPAARLTGRPPDRPPA
ncbi:MAG: thiolase C-terminal domain-containing protein [Streptosporangiaceae bacterium]